MKKRYMSIACMALGITLIATGCKKEEEKDTFNLNAVIEEVNGGQKVHMENALPVWDNNDAIRVNNENCTVSITGSGTNRKNSIAKQVEEAEYCAFYPASYLDENTNITNHSGICVNLPRCQEYSKTGNDQIVRMPMIAYSNTTDLHFKNLCSVLKVTVTNTTGHEFKLDSIQVKCDNSNLWGRCSVSLGNNDYTSVRTPDGMSGLTSGGKVVSLCGANETSMNETFADRAAKTFYIVVPTVSTADTFRIRLGIEEGFLINKKTPDKVSVDRNKLISLPFSATDFEQPIDVIIGPFTVDASGTKVSFSTGNLWYSRSEKGGDGKFHFETHQYDYTTIPLYGYANAMHISHFWWDKDASNTYGSGDTYTFDSRDWLFTNDTSSPNKANRSFEVEGVKGKFRTLSTAEWTYLTTSRAFLTNSGCAIVTLTDVNKWGLVILPDPATTINPATLTTMNAVTAAGAAFLPAAGGRMDPYGTYNEQVWGVYWVSDNLNDENHARSFDFSSNNSFGFGEGTRTTARSIRLVCKYVAPSN